MPRYLIEVPHNPDLNECLREVRSFLQAGAHFLTNSDWGCFSGDHRAWLTFEAEDDATARLAVPPAVRHKARLIRLNKFNLDYIKAMENINEVFVGGKPPEDIPLDEYLGLMGQTFIDLSQRLGVQPTNIKLARVERVDWPDASLSNPEPGRVYAQVVTPGFRMELVAGGKAYRYHTSKERAVFVGESLIPR
jgi:hypothetical protein